MILTNAEAELLLPIGTNEFGGTVEELCEEITNAYWVWDDAPFHHRIREKNMDILRNLAIKLNFVIQ